jgi:hypothetical protein
LRHVFESVGLRVGDKAHGVCETLDVKHGLPIDICALLVLLGKRLGIKVREVGAITTPRSVMY